MNFKDEMINELRRENEGLKKQLEELSKKLMIGGPIQESDKNQLKEAINKLMVFLHN